MRNTTMLLAAVAAGAFNSAAIAGDDAAGETKPISGTFDNYVVFDATTPTITTDHSLTVTVEGKASDDVTLGADFYAGVATDLGAGSFTLDTPEVTLRLESVVAGTFEVLDTDTALEAACVQPAGGSSNFGNEDLMTFGTCEAFSDGQSILYTSPVFSGFTVYLSAMTDPWNVILPGDVDTSISAALGYEQAVGDATLTASLGVDQALTVKGGGMLLPTLIQGGAELAWDDWSVGAAGEVELSSLAGGTNWAAGIGASRELFENFTVTGEVAANGYEDLGTPMNEYSLGITAEYALLKDVLWLDAGLNVVRTIGGGADTTTYSVATGLYYSQAF